MISPMKMLFLPEKKNLHCYISFNVALLKYIIKIVMVCFYCSENIDIHNLSFHFKLFLLEDKQFFITKG